MNALAVLHRRDLIGGVALGLAGTAAASCQARPGSTAGEAAPTLLIGLKAALADKDPSERWATSTLAPDATLDLWRQRVSLPQGELRPKSLMQALRDALNQSGMAPADAIGAGDFLVLSGQMELALAGRGRSGILRIDHASLNDGPGQIHAIALADGSPFAEAVSVRDFGARGDGRSDDSHAIATAYQALLGRGGGTLLFPPGTYHCHVDLTSRLVHLEGAGSEVSILQPVDPGRPILRGGYTSGSWDVVRIGHLRLVGVNGQGIGFRAAAAGRPGDEYAGRTRFVDCAFGDLDVCIERDFGQIGLWIEQCRFGSARLHLMARSVADATARKLGQDIMHSGVMTVRQTHFTGAREACVLIDSPATGGGQFFFDDCQMENNSGFVFDIRRIVAGGGNPGVRVRHCWNERNGDAVGGIYASIVDAAQIVFEDTPLGPLRLRGAHVTTLDCPLDQLRSIERDSSATINHVRARSSGDVQPQGRVDSIAASTATEPMRASMFELEPSRALSTRYDASLLLSVTADTPFMLLGRESRGTSTVPGAALPGHRTSQAFVIEAGETFLPTPVRISPKHWAVWIYIYRIIEGEAPDIRLNGQVGASGVRSLTSRDWSALGGLSYLPHGSSDLSIWHSLAGAGRARINIGGLALLQFPTHQAATDCLNAKTFPVSA